MPHVAITGSTGHVGAGAARILSAAGVSARLLVRDPDRAPDLPHTEVVRAEYDHVPRCVAALEGIDTVFMVSIVDGAERLTAHQDFVDAAVQAGVRHVVYLSFVGADEHAASIYPREHGATEAYLAATDLDTTIVRSNYFAESLMHFYTGDQISGPVGDGRISAVARDDVAAAVAAVLADPSGHVAKTYELTGAEALSFADIAALIEKVLGEPCDFVDQTDEQARASRSSLRAPDEILQDWLSMYVAVRQGAHGHVTGDVRHLLGRDPELAISALSRLQE